MRTRSIVLCTGFLLFGWAIPTGIAGQITFTLTATATGTIGVANFTNATVTIVAIGDTTSRYLFYPDTWAINPTDSTVSIAGIGTATFTDPGYIFDDQFSGLAGFGTITQVTAPCESAPGCDLLDVHSNPALTTYDLTTSIGPLSDTSGQLQNDWAEVSTSLGSITLSSLATNATFAADAVPEPSTYLLLFSGLICLSQIHRRKV